MVLAVSHWSKTGPFDIPSVPLPSPEGVVLGLKVVSVEHRVVGLLGTWTDHVESSSDLSSLLDLVWKLSSFPSAGRTSSREVHSEVPQ